MYFDDDSVHEEKRKYFITYRNKLNDSMGVVTKEALSKSEVEEYFNEKSSDYEIVKTRDLYEWTEEIGKELASDLIKHIKTIESLFEVKPTININKTREIDYNSKSFLGGLKKVRKEVEKSNELSKPDSDKMNSSFNI
jgi:hypothetical protein